MGREREQGTGMQLFKSRCKRAGASSGECLGGCLGWLGASALRPGRGRAETASGSVASIATSKHEGGPTRVFDGSDGSLGGGWCGAPSTAAVPAGCRPHPVADSAWLAVLLTTQQYTRQAERSPAVRGADLRRRAPVIATVCMCLCTTNLLDAAMQVEWRWRACVVCSARHSLRTRMQPALKSSSCPCAVVYSQFTVELSHCSHVAAVLMLRSDHRHSRRARSARSNGDAPAVEQRWGTEGTATMARWAAPTACHLKPPPIPAGAWGAFASRTSAL